MFKKYSSLENAYRENFIQACHELGAKEWVALEKVHGCNFGFICNEGEVVPFKRTSVIGTNPNTGEYEFYGCNSVVEQYKESVINLESIVGQPIQIYGELYGEGIQKEVQYGRKDFIAFDIFLIYDQSFMCWEGVVNACQRAEIPTVPELGRGSLEDMLNIPPEFDSIVSNVEGSQAEGVVIKQSGSEVFLRNGSRAIIKNKSATFSEKKHRKPKKPHTVPEHLKGELNTFCMYLNESRLSNVLSKESMVTQKDFGRIQGLLVQDAKEDFEKDGNVVSKDDWKTLSKQINKEASSVVRKEWLNILDKFSTI